MSDTGGEPGELAEGTLISHLLELRDRIMKAMIAVFVCFIPCAIYMNQLFTFIAQPLIHKLPAGASLIATSVVSPFMVPFKLAFVVAFVMAIPVVLYQVWAFVAPGLYRHEKKLAVPLLISSVLLFYIGAAFAYFLVFPFMLGFFVGTTPAGVQMMTDMGSYLDFVMILLLDLWARLRGADRDRSAGMDRLRQDRDADQEPRIRAARHIHPGRLSDAAGRGIAKLHGRADVHPVRDRYIDVQNTAQGQARGARQGRRGARSRDLVSQTFFGHPRGLATLFFTEMWERFTYYGMRALLVLFLVAAVSAGGFGIDDKTATAIYGLYTAGVYLIALPGGWIADRLIGACTTLTR